MNKKEQVIYAASKLFSEKGFEKTSMNDICRAADVSKGLVYHHFASKSEILKEIFLQTTEKMKEFGSVERGVSPSDQLVSLIETYFSQLEQEKGLFQLNLNMMFNPSTRTLLQSELKARSEAILASTQAIFNQIDQNNSVGLSHLFIAELDGVALDYLSVFDDYPLETVKELLKSKYQKIEQ